MLFGTIYDSPVLRRAGYGELIDTLGDANTYTGIYLFVNGDFPIVESDSCLLKASAAGELRFWYFWDQDVGGGRLSGAVHATVLCVVSGRGQVDLQYARLDHGGQSLGRICEGSACDLFGGRFWVAGGGVVLARYLGLVVRSLVGRRLVLHVRRRRGPDLYESRRGWS